jgi:RNA polymerase sigma-70 factor (ECF subfamily)
MSGDPSDESLIEAIHKRDIAALEALYDRHRVLAYSLALRILSSPSDAEDIVQESFLNVWRSAGTFRADRSSARSWLLSIVHHRCVDKLRGRQNRIQPVALAEGMDLPDSTDVWEEVMANLTGQDVRSALEQLPIEQREAIELAYFKGYTQNEIAREVNVPLGTVKGRMRIGLHKLKDLLEKSHTRAAVE